MKKLLLLICLLSLQYPLLAQHQGHTTPAVKSQTNYTCHMHPEIQSDKPGNCPKCGMKLFAQKPQGSKSPATVKESSVPVTKPARQAAPTTPVKKSQPAMNHNMDEMKMPSKAAAPVKDPSDTHDHENMKMPMNEGQGKMEGIADMNQAKMNLGPIKTIANSKPPRTVRYDLYIADTIVSYGKKSKRAIAVNGQIPMPTLTFTQGDTALIYVHNNLDEETSLHWHGLFLPNRMDGVPFLTQMPIKPHSTYIYKFPIIQHGTHWYHSHSGLQEQIGMYGAFIMNKRKEWDIPTIPLVLSEWTDMKPEEVHRSLKNASDWFAIQKGTTQSYAEAIKTGHFKTKVNNEWKRMNAMDVSDVYYDAFLINGKNKQEQPQFKAGDKVRLRIANAGASDYFWLKYAGGKITVVATDGNDVEPVEVDRLIIATSETYDVVVTIPENKSYEFLVTPEDRTKSASLWLGKGEKVPAGTMPKLKYFAGMKMMNDMMDMQGNMKEMGGMKMQNQAMDMNTVMYPEITGEENAKSKSKNVDAPSMQMPNNKSIAGMNMASDNPDIITLNYNMLRDAKKTTLPEGPWKELRFELTGNMNRYVWSLDNKTISESDKILIKKGENIRIILYNNSMMRHPMHLHGHDFRVLNEQGENAPMKNVLDIMPMERDTIEFAASEQGGDWFFHCHILYHMMSGMGRVFSYQDTLVDKTDILDAEYARRRLNAEDSGFHPMAAVGLESNGSDGKFILANTRYRFSTEWRLGLKAHHGNESETYFGKYIGKMQWLFPFIGFDYHYNSINNMKENNLFGQVSNQKNRKAAVLGVQYILPMLVTAEARLDSKGKVRFQLMREDIPVSSRLRMNFMGNTDKEYMAGLRYIVTKYFSLSTHYDSDMGYGGGITLNY